MYGRVINAVNAPFSSQTTGVGTSPAYLVEDAIAWTVSALTESGLTSSVLTVQVSNSTVERREPVTVPEGTWSSVATVAAAGVYEGPPGVRFVRLVRDVSIGGVVMQPILNKLVG